MEPYAAIMMFGYGVISAHVPPDAGNVEHVATFIPVFFDVVQDVAADAGAG